MRFYCEGNEGSALPGHSLFLFFTQMKVTSIAKKDTLAILVEF
jgi:hypothetical protein